MNNNINNMITYSLPIYVKLNNININKYNISNKNNELIKNL